MDYKEPKEIKSYVHVVKSYAGDSYWRTYIKIAQDKNKAEKEYIRRYGEEMFDVLMAGRKTDKEIEEGNNKTGDYFFDKNGTQWVAQ